ncbi:hypothetical protein BGW38_008070 [Lunasporangiospora selenospora]|uniref:Hemerythrin-like domain-containing protein n=1 Tax=Lunasporangiospora selenospora TaxID=979761 RepID=A0A9P6FY37_9FUNG|nr:hypothetical protein BGW38_008070 [Lunasporangiospora selenospora]
MNNFHKAYYDHLVAIHNRLRYELRHCLHTLPNCSQQSSLRSTLHKVLQFSSHLQGHHDLEEAIIFPAFAKVTDISHWSHSHEELHSTLDKVRMLARDGLDQKVEDFTENKSKLVEELQNLSDIVLPHLTDEEVLSHPSETIKLWPTEKDMRRAFPWM